MSQNDTLDSLNATVDNKNDDMASSSSSLDGSGEAEIIPEEVAAETVVMTTDTQEGLRSEALGIEEMMVQGIRGDVASSDLTDDDGSIVQIRLIENPDDGTIWSQFGFTKSSVDAGISESGLLEVQCPMSSLVSDGMSVVANHEEISTKPDSPVASIRDLAKREKDRLKKQEMRANPVYRQKEKIKARVRMQNRRADPLYREQERQRDRERRKLARRRNDASRQKERERDKEYKKLHRSVGVPDLVENILVLDTATRTVFSIPDSGMDSELVQQT